MRKVDKEKKGGVERGTETQIDRKTETGRKTETDS